MIAVHDMALVQLFGALFLKFTAVIHHVHLGLKSDVSFSLAHVLAD